MQKSCPRHKSCSDEESTTIQSLSLTSDDIQHMKTQTDSSSSSDEEVEYYGGNVALPIFKTGFNGNSFTALDIAQKLLWTDRSEVICHTVPTDIQDDVVFLVNNASFNNVDDLKCDDLGVWRANKVASDFFQVHGRVDICQCDVYIVFFLEEVFTLQVSERKRMLRVTQACAGDGALQSYQRESCNTIINRFQVAST